MSRVATSQLRDDLADTLNRVAYGRERIVLERYGKDLVALISLDDLRLLEELEDQRDIQEARLALAEAKVEGTVPFEVVCKELGL
jgi:prevent-host-death family protein